MDSAAGSSGLSAIFHAKNRITSTTKLQNQHFSPPNFLESHPLLPNPIFSSISCCSSTSSARMSIHTKNDQLLQLVDQQRTREIGNWNLIQKLAATILDNIEDNLIINMLERDHPLPKTADPKIQIAGNFAPVAEQPVCHNLHVHGQIPPSIDGVYVRNGANPLFNPVAGHHFFDGDGMVHAISLKSGVATYACRFTETERLVQERAIGRPVFPKAIGELHGHSGIARLLLFYARGVLGLIDNGRGTGVANAGLVYFNNRLLAMSEDDLPYQVRITDHGDLKTVGRYNFDGQLQSSASMIAHPKVDPSTKEMFALSYDIIHKPYLKYFWFTPKGTKSEDVDIPLEQPTMMHDFAITENFVVIPDQQVVFSLQDMIRGGSPVVFDKKKKSRFGIFPKYTSEVDNTIVKWIEVPDCFCFHLWNAWETDDNDDEGEIVVIGSCMTPPDSVFNECGQQNTQSVLSEIRLNPRTGKSTRRPVILNSQTENQNQQQLNLEAGTVSKTLTGRKTQYVYLAIVDPWPKVSGIAKVDLSSGQVTKYMFGEGKFGGEPYFVPREPNLATTTNAHVKEDDGYILTFVHDERTAESKLLIVNAVEMRLEAAVTMPSRVPYGFHGTFIRTEELESQA